MIFQEIPLFAFSQEKAFQDSQSFFLHQLLKNPSDGYAPQTGASPQVVISPFDFQWQTGQSNHGSPTC